MRAGAKKEAVHAAERLLETGSGSRLYEVFIINLELDCTSKRANLAKLDAFGDATVGLVAMAALAAASCAPAVRAPKYHQPHQP